MEPKRIVINEVEYVPASSVSKATGQVRIVILQRGWVMIGYYKRDGENCSLERAAVLRNFGTTRGLGEIAAGGPTKDTKLDPCNGLVEFHRLTEIATIACEDSKWVKHL